MKSLKTILAGALLMFSTLMPRTTSMSSRSTGS